MGGKIAPSPPSDRNRNNLSPALAIVSLDMENLECYDMASHSMARANMNKSKKLVTNTTAALKYIEVHT